MRKLLQFLCCIGLCVLPLGSVPYTRALAEMECDGADLIENIELLRGDAALNNGDGVASSDDLILRYTLKTLEEGMNLPGSEWIIPIPKYIENNHMTLNQPIQLEGKTIAYAKATDQKDKIRLIFETDLGDLPIYNMNFEFNAKLNMDDLAGRQDAEIDLTHGKSVKLKVMDNAVKDPAVTAKSGKVDENGVITWTVSLSKEIAPFDDGLNAPQYTQDYQFRDELTDKQNYVNGSFTLKVKDQESHPAAVQQGQTLSATLDQGLSQDAVVTYQTKPSSVIYIDENGQLADLSKGVKVTNTAQLWKPDGSEKLSEVHGEAVVKGESWMTKTGVTYDLVNKTMTWKLVIHTQSLPLRQITVYDQLEDRLSYDKKDANVKVNKTTSLPGVEVNPNFDGRTNGDQMLLKIDQPTEAQYEIIYTTHFDLDLTTQNQETPLKNKAWLEVDWDPDGADGPLPEDKYGIPVIEKEHKLPTSVVEKKGSYDPATRYITWTVTLNKNLLSVKDGHILDTLTTTNQKFIGNPQIITPSTGYTIEMNEQADQKTDTTELYEVLIRNDSGEINTFDKKIVFTYQTEATNPEFYANNAKMKFPNEVVFGSDQIPDLTAKAQPEFTSTVLEKSAEGYNYQTHEISWKIVVNKNATKLTDVKVKDALPDYLSYVENSMNVQFSNNPAAQQEPTLTDEGIEVDLGTINEKVTITFKTKLNVNAENLPGNFRFDQSNTASDAKALLELTNTAVLEKQEGSPVTQSGKIKIANQAFNKSSVVHSDRYTVDYTIQINQAGADLSAICPKGLVITDTMSEELLLDEDSVVLRKAEIQADGSFKAGAVIDGVKAKVSGNQTVFELPLTLDLSGSYILIYSAFVNVASKGEFALSNQASLGSQTSGLANQDAMKFQSKYSAGSAMRIPGRASLELTKTAADDGKPVAGAEYGLFAKDTDGKSYLMQKAVTDASGKAMFNALKVKPSENVYTVKELSAPQGFELDPQEYEVTMTVKAGKIQTLEVSDQRLRGSVSFLKQDQYGKPVQGAVFAIYPGDISVTEQTPPLAKAASDPQGQVLFTDLDLDQSYLIAELEAPQGYEKTESLFKVTVGSDGKAGLLIDETTHLEVLAVVNQKRPTPAPDQPESEHPDSPSSSNPRGVLPYTGDQEFVLALTGGLTLIIAGLALTLWKRRRS